MLFSKYTQSIHLFFFVIAFIITFGYLLLAERLLRIGLNVRFIHLDSIILMISLLLISSWFYTMTTNGIRQGIALVFLYHSLFKLIFEGKKVIFFIFFLLAVSFHYSSLLVVPFLLFVNIGYRRHKLLWILLALGYALGLNEEFVRMVSVKFNLPVYDYIKYYSLERGQLDGGYYNGFDARFFAYTLFWPFLLIIIDRLRLSGYRVSTCTVNYLLEMYFLLCMPYFVFGFGPFSNRYAMLSWFMVPLLQVFLLSSFKFKKESRYVVLLCFFIALPHFLFVTLDWKRLIL